MDEKKKASPTEIILTILTVSLSFISGMFVGDGIINEWNLYSTIGILIIFYPIILGIILGIFSYILEKLEKFINKFHLYKKSNKNNKFKIHDPTSKLFELIGLPESIGVCFIFGFFGLIVMVLGFREGGFESVKLFLRNMGLLILAILIRWGVLKIIKTIFRCSYAVALCILVLLSWIVGFGMMYYKETEEKNNAYYIDIKYGKKIDVQYYESLSTFPSTFIQYAYYNDSREHLILKIDGEYYQWCNYPYSMRKDFKNANSYGNFFNQFIKGNEKYECE